MATEILTVEVWEPIDSHYEDTGIVVTDDWDIFINRVGFILTISVFLVLILILN